MKLQTQMKQPSARELGLSSSVLLDEQKKQDDAMIKSQEEELTKLREQLFEF